MKELKIWKLVQTTMKLSLEDEIYKQEILVYMKKSDIFGITIAGVGKIFDLKGEFFCSE